MTQAPLSSATKWEPKGVTSQGKASDNRAGGAVLATPSPVSPGTGASSPTPTLHTLSTHHLLLS